MNGDGKLDLFVMEKSNNRALTFINNGSTTDDAYKYDPNYASKFPRVPLNSWATCVDYNCDGKMDFLTMNDSGTKIILYRNDYSVSNGLKFTLVSDSIRSKKLSNGTLSPIFASFTLMPAFIDVDNDGDLDMLGFNEVPDGRIAYHRNYAEEHFGRCDTLEFVYEDKCWGNFAFCFGTNTVCTYHSACAQPVTKPVNEDGSDPFAFQLAKRDDSITTLFALDLDGDGAKELLVGDAINPTSLMIHNGGTPTAADADTSDETFPSYDQSILIHDFVFHNYLDVDNDGLKDLIATAGSVEDYRDVWYYKNVGSNSAPVFNIEQVDFLQRSMIDLGSAAYPVLFDYDADGVKDLLVAYNRSEPSSGVPHCGIAAFKNTGTVSSPAFKLMNDDYAVLSQYSASFGNYMAITFGDLDNDGDADMIVGAENGKLHYFQNIAGAGQPANFQLQTPQYMNIDVGNRAIPQLYDLNNDGKLDLIVGAENGMVKYYQNNGTAAAASFSSTPTIDPLGHVDVRSNSLNGYASPFFFKYSGTTYMLISNMDGYVYLYDNIDGNLSGTFNRKATVVQKRELGTSSMASAVTVTAADINNDSIPDVLAGLLSGGVKIYFGTTAIGIDEHAHDIPFQLFPNPVSNDLQFHFKNAGPKKITFFNALGQKADELSAQGDLTYSTLNLPNGFYVVELNENNETFFQKIIMEHE